MCKLICCFQVIGIILMIALIGCSSGKVNPVVTPNTEFPVANLANDVGNHELVGVWTSNFDVNSLTATIEPNRETLAHFSVRPLLPTPGIVVKSWDPVTQIISVDVTIRNTSALNGYDLRLIIYTDAIGHLLLNADNWTGLFDVSGGDTINPFKAYAKETPNRIFEGHTQQTENLQIYMPGANFAVNFAIDASYPSNCTEPYLIENFQNETLYDEVNSTALAGIDIFHWNPSASIFALLTCPEILNTNQVPFLPDGTDHYTGTITNVTGAAEGEYNGLLRASSDTTPDLYLYDPVTIIVTQKPVVKEGWVKQFTDMGITGIEVNHLGLIIGLEDDNRLITYTTNGDPAWSHDLIPDDRWRGYKDLSCNNQYDYIFIAGDGEFCSTVDDTGLMVGQYGPSNQKNWVQYKCNSNGTSLHGSAVVSGENTNCYLTGYDWDDMATMAKLKVTDGSNIWYHQFTGDGGLVFDDLVWYGSTSRLVGVGEFWGTTVDFDPSSSILNRTPVGERDAFLTSWDSNGVIKKLSTWGESSTTQTAIVKAKSVALDSSNNIYILGSFSGLVDFDPGGTTNNFNSGGNDDIYISKFGPTGTYIKTIVIQCITDDAQDWNTGNTIIPDKDNNIYITGGFDDLAKFDPASAQGDKTSNGFGDVYLAKYTSNLEFIWVRTWGSNDTLQSEGKDVACDPNNGLVYLTGTFSGTVDFDPGTGVFELTAIGASGVDTFLMKLLPNGYWE